MNGYYLAYALLALGLAGLEVYGVWFRPASEDTISEAVAALFRTQTLAGWWVLMALCGTVAVWFPGHTRRLAMRRRDRQ